jgi:hypothetical protein
MPSFGIFEATRLKAEALMGQKVRPAVKMSYAVGSPEYAKQQAEKAAELRGPPAEEPAKTMAPDPAADVRDRISGKIAQLQNDR